MRMFKKLILISLTLLLPLAITGCECFWIWTEIYANRDVPAAEQDFLPAKDIYICAGESALLRWSSHKKLTQAWITPDVGEVSPRGQTVVSPFYTTEYRINAEGGGCRSSSSATVHVVQPGDVVYLKADEIYDPFTDSYYWQVETKEQIFSPNILVNSIQAERETDEVGPWTVSKMGPNGVVHELTIPEDRPVSPSERFSILGSWSFWPDKNYEGRATFILRIECQG
jgi:hypothetical protein